MTDNVMPNVKRVREQSLCTLASEWAHFEQEALRAMPKAVTPLARRAFYAGALGFLNAMTQRAVRDAQTGELSEDLCMPLREELLTFIEQMRTGSA